MSEDSNPVVTLKVRVTPEFREKIVTTAKENNRSMNQEIVHRLEESFMLEGETLSSIDDFKVSKDPRERRRLAVVAAMAVLEVLGSDHSDDKKAP